MRQHHKAYVIVGWHVSLALYAALSAYMLVGSTTGYMRWLHVLAGVLAFLTALVWASFGKATRQEQRVGR